MKAVSGEACVDEKLGRWVRAEDGRLALADDGLEFDGAADAGGRFTPAELGLQPAVAGRAGQLPLARCRIDAIHCACCDIAGAVVD